MVDGTTFRQLALSFNGTEAAPHFDRIAFKITGRRIFATLLEEKAAANLFLSLDDQKIYSAYNEAAVYPVPNKWGLKGWTTFELNSLPVELVSDALLAAYSHALQTAPAARRKK